MITWRRALLIAIAVFAVALATRLLWITVPINIDEALWIRRGPAFFVGLLTGDPAATYQKHHPGVTNMWIVGAALSLRYWLRDLLPPDALISQSAGLVDYLSAAATATTVPLSSYTAARWASAIVTAASMAAFYLLSRRVYGLVVAVTATTILLFEPFFIAYQRSITTDANQTNFMWISYLALIVYAGISATPPRSTQMGNSSGGREAPSARNRQKVGLGAAGWLLVSGVFFGLAVLSKATTVLTLPAFFLVGAVAIWRARATRGWLRLIGAMLVWGGAVVLVAFLLWPALRSNLWGTLAQWYYGLSGEVEGHNQFLLGQYTGNPSAFYYPVVLVARLSPLLLAGSLLGLAALLAPRLRIYYTHRAETAAALLLSAIILTGITFFAAKVDRYVVPMMPGLALTAAGGIWACLRAWQARRGLHDVRPARALAEVVAAIIVAQLVVLLPQLPYFLTYFSPLIGGTRGAQHVLMVGNGELLDQAADWLEQNVPADALVGQYAFRGSMSPYYDGRVQDIVMSPAPGGWLADMEYLVMYSAFLQRRLPAQLVDYLEPQRPLHVVQWRGADYAKIYPGPSVRPENRASLPNPTELDFGESARLVGYELETPEVRAGDTAVLTLFWESVAPFPADDFGVDVGARDSEGNLYAQAYTIPVGNFVPVNQWKPGRILRDANLIRIPPGTPPGDYSLEVSFFSPELKQALQIRDENGPRGNRVPLVRVRVQKPEHPLSKDGDPGIQTVLPAPVVLGQDGPQLLGYTWNDPVEVTAGDGLPLSLLWQAGKEAPAGAQVLLRLSAAGEAWRRSVGHLLGGVYPPERWEVGELVRDSWTALLPADVPEGRYRLELVATGSVDEQPLLDLGEIALKARSHDFSAPAPTYAQQAVLGDVARLVGFDVAGGAACNGGLCLTPGAPLGLTLWWQAAAESERDLVRFAHLLDAEGRIVAQSDERPGGLPATGWALGEYQRDSVTLETDNLPAGSYSLAVGLYNPVTGARLAAPDGRDLIPLSQTLEIR